jgi:hypothetical protein
MWAMILVFWMQTIVSFGGEMPAVSASNDAKWCGSRSTHFHDKHFGHYLDSVTCNQNNISRQQWCCNILPRCRTIVLEDRVRVSCVVTTKQRIAPFETTMRVQLARLRKTITAIVWTWILSRDQVALPIRLEERVKIFPAIARAGKSSWP